MSRRIIVPAQAWIALSVGLWLMRELVESLSLMHAGGFQRRLLLLLLII